MGANVFSGNRLVHLPTTKHPGCCALLVRKTCALSQKINWWRNFRQRIMYSVSITGYRILSLKSLNQFIFWLEYRLNFNLYSILGLWHHHRRHRELLSVNSAHFSYCRGLGFKYKPEDWLFLLEFFTALRISPWTETGSTPHNYAFPFQLITR